MFKQSIKFWSVFIPLLFVLDPVSAGIVAGGSILGGVIGSKGASKAGREQAKATRASIAEQRRQFDITQAQAAPYRKVGSQALFSLADMMGVKTENPYEPGTPEYTAFENRQTYDFQKSPGYQFRLEEGMKGLERSQAGRRLGGRAAKEALRYGQGFASNEYGSAFNRLSTLAGFGPPTVGAGMPTGIPGTIEAGGRAQAETSLAQAGIANQAIQGGLQNYMTYQNYNQPVAGDAYMPAAQYGG